MKNLSSAAKVYIFGTILIGFALTAWTAVASDWANPGLYLLAALGAVAQTLRVEGPNSRTNYSIAWFVYGFAFLTLGPASAILVVVVSHLVEGFWHKYPWYIQSFNVGAHIIPLYLSGLVFVTLNRGNQALNLLGALGMAVANLIFVLGNHFLVGVAVKLARGQSFAESGVFEFLTLFLDFTVLSMGAVTALIWSSNPLASLLNILPLVLLYHAIRVPALLRQLKELKQSARKIPARGRFRLPPVRTTGKQHTTQSLSEISSRGFFYAPTLHFCNPCKSKIRRTTYSRKSRFNAKYDQVHLCMLEAKFRRKTLLASILCLIATTNKSVKKSSHNLAVI